MRLDPHNQVSVHPSSLHLLYVSPLPLMFFMEFIMHHSLEPISRNLCPILISPFSCFRSQWNILQNKIALFQRDRGALSQFWSERVLDLVHAADSQKSNRVFQCVFLGKPHSLLYSRERRKALRLSMNVLVPGCVSSWVCVVS